MPRNPECKECDLYAGVTSVCVWGRGNEKSGVLFIGEAPGADEDEKCLPFVGQAGTLLDDEAEAAGLTSKDFFIHNVVRCRPPDNRTPKISECHKCFPYLKEVILETKPWLIVCMGAVASKKVLGATSLKAVRDVVKDRKLYDTKVDKETPYYECKTYAMYHPAAILRTPELRQTFKDEMRTVGSIVREHRGEDVSDIYTMDESHHFVIDDLDTLRKFADKVEDVPEKSGDLETTGFNFFEDEILCAGVSWKPHYAAAVSLYGQGMVPTFKGGTIDEAYVQLARIFGGNIIGQNWAFDKKFLWTKGIKPKPTYFDVMLAHHLIWEYLPHNLTDISLQLGLSPRYDSEVHNFPGAKESFAAVPTGILTRYLCNDVDVTYRAKEPITSHSEWPGVEGLYYNTVMPCQEVITDMTYQGVCIDEERLLALREKLTKDFTAAENFLRANSHRVEDFNWRSWKQLAKELYELRGLPVMGRTDNKTVEFPEGAPSTGKWELGQLIKYCARGLEMCTNLDDHIAWEKTLEYLNTLSTAKKLGKVCSTFVGYASLPDDMQKGISRFIRNGRVHTDYLLTGTQTGRYSSHDPNLQQIPRGYGVRNIFIADPNCMFVEADYSQAEFRVLAWLSGDEAMKDAFRAGHDFHASVASRIYGIPVEDVNKEQRVTAKFINFGIAYQRGPQSIADQIGCTKQEGQAYIDAFYDAYPMVRVFVDECKRAVDNPGYVQTPFGRRRRFLPTEHRDIHAEYQRQAVNMMEQSTVADALSRATVDIHRVLNSMGLKSRLIMTLHDALMLSVVPEELDHVKQTLQFCMTDNITIPGTDLQLPIDIEVGHCWAEEKEEDVVPEEAA